MDQISPVTLVALLDHLLHLGSVTSVATAILVVTPVATSPFQKPLYLVNE